MKKTNASSHNRPGTRCRLLLHIGCASLNRPLTARRQMQPLNKTMNLQASAWSSRHGPQDAVSHPASNSAPQQIHKMYMYYYIDAMINDGRQTDTVYLVRLQSQTSSDSKRPCPHQGRKGVKKFCHKCLHSGSSIPSAFK